jgi:hypothetical protein
MEPFTVRASRLVAGHAIVRRNAYASWFTSGEATREEVARFTREFSVFSHQFIAAQLRKVMNAPDLDSYHAGKEILLNELGVAFRPPQGATAGTGPDDVSPTGTVEGAAYRHASAHFEWLVKFAAPLGLGFAAMGKRRHGSPSTLAFCDALLDLYGSEDASLAAGASYATEHWAAAGFWKQLIAGLQAFKQRSGLPLNLGFWVFHDRLEQQHADHTTEELEELRRLPGFDEAAFLDGAQRMLDAIAGFWTVSSAVAWPPRPPLRSLPSPPPPSNFGQDGRKHCSLLHHCVQ